MRHICVLGVPVHFGPRVTPGRLKPQIDFKQDQCSLRGHTLKTSPCWCIRALQNSLMQKRRPSVFLERTFERHRAQTCLLELFTAVYTLYPRCDWGKHLFNVRCSNETCFSHSRAAWYGATPAASACLPSHCHLPRFLTGEEPKWHHASDLKLTGANVAPAHLDFTDVWLIPCRTKEKHSTKTTEYIIVSSSSSIDTYD